MARSIGIGIPYRAIGADLHVLELELRLDVRPEQGPFRAIEQGDLDLSFADSLQDTTHQFAAIGEHKPIAFGVDLLLGGWRRCIDRISGRWIGDAPGLSQWVVHRGRKQQHGKKQGHNILLNGSWQPGVPQRNQCSEPTLGRLT